MADGKSSLSAGRRSCAEWAGDGEEARMRVRVRALGGLNVYGRDGRPWPIAGSCRPVLGYLLTFRRRPVGRNELAETLWANSDAGRAKRSLSTALWRLRKATVSAAPLVTLHGDELSCNWSALAWVDALALELRVQPLLSRKPDTLTRRDLARLERGVAVYRGDYLLGIDQEWTALERQRLRNLYCDGLYQLTLAYATASEPASVIKWGRRLAQEEPLREDVHRLLMRAYAQDGNRAMAIGQYRECQRVLAQDLGVQPMAETQQLYRQLLRAEVPVVHAGNEASLAHARRRIVRVRRVLATSQQQLDRALDALGPRDPMNRGE
jgi:DNA-binding SARP family transcriptional activator